ncbi:hypothetical protein [Actinomadura sp. 21ATH]|uniref:hypothetical protein n=1 Tax=Actinomadura sp. 21ATH TaxID=1735444 RepID=UPI0035BF0A77
MAGRRRPGSAPGRHALPQARRRGAGPLGTRSLLAAILLTTVAAALVLQMAVDSALPGREPREARLAQPGPPEPSPSVPALPAMKDPTAVQSRLLSPEPEEPEEPPPSPSTTEPDAPGAVPLQRVREVLGDVDRSVEEGLGRRQIRGDVGTDLVQTIRGLRAQSDRDRLRRGVGGLRDKIRKRAREDGISPERAGELLRILDRSPL